MERNEIEKIATLVAVRRLGLHGLILTSEAAARLFVSGATQSLGWAWLLGLVTGHAQPTIRQGMAVRTNRPCIAYNNRPCIAYNQAGHGCWN